jgi:HSP20 family protein
LTFALSGLTLKLDVTNLHNLLERDIIMASLQKRTAKPTHDLSSQLLLNPFVSIQKEVDKALHGFYDLFESKPASVKGFENLRLAPAMDLIEDADCFKLEVD